MSWTRQFLTALATFGLLLWLALCILLAVLPLPAAAQGAQGAPRDMVISRLAEKYGETRQSMGLGSNNNMMEVFASLATGSWTITVTTPQGVTCLVASGQAYEELAEVLPPKGDPL
ncbi:hypothetical protein [Tropicibacter sp. S64]|uniref:hypothetical protein n=1 Tax=Tropicibacter sp. S64 TaxID=3415122 RepID=UPI003C7A0E79